MIQNDRTGALSTVNNQMVFDASKGNCIDRADTAGCNGKGWREDKSYTLNTMDRHAVCVGNGQLAQAKLSEKVGALNCMHDQQAVLVNTKTYQDVTGTLDCCIAKGTSNQLANSNMFVANTSIVRRLTPMECERLQGYPDLWTDIGEWVDTKGKKHKAADSPRYKALGNSIALPFWQWMAERMVRLIKNDEPEKEPTMASLFSGIGGFELVFARAGCKPKWNSEIEPYPEAVTRAHFGDDEKGIKGDYERYL